MMKTTRFLAGLPPPLDKYTPKRRFEHKYRGIPRKKSELEGNFDLKDLATWDFLLKVSR